MHNPLVLLSAALVSALLREGFTIFVRQSYPAGESPSDAHIKEVLLITPYKDIGAANAHFQHIRFDRRKYIYQSFHPEEVEKLYTAASQPTGYKIYVALIAGDKQTPDAQLAPVVRQYISRHTQWPPEKTNATLCLHYGDLYISLRYQHEELKVPLPAIES
ncbi:hypothetical protein [Chitinophaga flava]|uniref:Uncharacterized protein n=1 Tax=Chitinophaga flava TaxID=2259036 RepID=A0A365XRC4_9BACT|nr:hypothetical protein [Chitinophaga flava]RBL88581.1 hypothetical protein DF182_18575 [Chitinophaga flava]